MIMRHELGDKYNDMLCVGCAASIEFISYPSKDFSVIQGQIFLREG